MKNDIEKRNKFIHFVERWLIIGIVLFIVVQLTALSVIKLFVPDEIQLTEEQYEEYDNDYIGHWYCGTFFINMTVDENFESMETYNTMMEESENDIVRKACYYSGGFFILLTIGFIAIAAYKEYKNKLLDGNTPLFVLLSGISMLLYKIIEEIDLFVEVSYWRSYSKGFLSTASYYPEIHYIFIIPTILIALGLILRQKQRKNLKLSTEKNEKFIKILTGCILTVGLGFLLYRFGIRIYELLMNLNGNSNIRIPFYYYIFDVPIEFAPTSGSYTKLVVLRLIKDLPVFIATAMSIILFSKILLSYTNKKDNKVNNKYYKNIFISLIISSIIFNLLGLVEVNLLNNEFLYQYKEAVYTIAIRSLTEPLFYALFIYSFKHYVELSELKEKNN
jgi:hypothetical protein